MFEFVLLDSHQCNRFLGEPAISNFYPRLPRKSRLKLYKEAERPLCNHAVNSYRNCIRCLGCAAISENQGEIYMRSNFLL
jgi:hypothetical protein